MDGWIACCSQRFFPLSRRIILDDSLAEDALQSSWIKVLQSIGRAHFKGPVACPWVRTIVANTARNITLQRHRRGELPLLELKAPGRNPEELAQEKQLLALLREMVSLLPKTYRQVIELRVIKGFSAQQTANLLCISRSNVSTRLNRSIQLLQKRFNARTSIAPARTLRARSTPPAPRLGSFSSNHLQRPAVRHKKV